MGASSLCRAGRAWAELGHGEIGRIELGRVELGRVELGLDERGLVERGRVERGRVERGRVERGHAERSPAERGRVDGGDEDGSSEGESSESESSEDQSSEGGSSRPSRTLPSIWDFSGESARQHTRTLSTAAQAARSMCGGCAARKQGQAAMLVRLIISRLGGMHECDAMLAAMGPTGRAIAHSQCGSNAAGEASVPGQAVQRTFIETKCRPIDSGPWSML